jgi:catechol 2,3-dioxygenase-like lactoylglutathione lyase family enzyme
MVMERSKLVPELIVTDLDDSLAFWVGVLGFTVAYARPEDRFAYLDRDGAQLMLEASDGVEGQWQVAPLVPPLGRGVNFQITVDAVAPILARLAQRGDPLFRPCEDRWYRAGAVEVGQREFIVQAPDGYLVRLLERLGERPV